LGLICALDSGALDEDARGELALTRGLLLYLAGNTLASRDEIDAMTNSFQRSGTANLVAAQLLVGLGTLHGRQGSYDRAVGDYQQALKMATRLGNDTMIATAMGNLGVCLGRLGMYEEQLKISSAAPQPWGTEFGGFIEIQLAYCQGLAHAMLGSPEKTDHAIRKVEERVCGNLPPWLDQAWSLWKADLRLLAGSNTVAHTTADRAMEVHDFRLLSPGFAGPFARWLGKIGSAGHWRAKAEIGIEALLRDANQYDALDHAEILCSSLLLSPHASRAARRRAELSDILIQLPPATIEQLKRLEVLPES
jgi:tetratricopeptide (TPR) repeat protein